MMVIIVLFLIVVFGYALTCILSKDLTQLERLSLGFLLGIGIVTLLIFYYSWMGLKINQLSVLGLIMILIIFTGFWVLKLKRLPKKESFNLIKDLYLLNFYEKTVILIIILLFVLSFTLASYFPINAWDALALYDFRAKVIANLGYFVQIQGDFKYFAQYPLLTSLTHTIVYIFGGINPQFTYPLYYFSLAAVFYETLKNKNQRLVALLAVLLLVSVPEIFQHSKIAYTNLPYTVFYVIGTIYLYRAVVRNKYEYIVLSSILFGLSTWVRADEPFWITSALVIIIYSVYRKSIIPALLYFPLFLLIQEPWKIYATHLFGETYSTTGQLAITGKTLLGGINTTLLYDVSIFVYNNVIRSWGFTTILFVLATLYEIKNKFSKESCVMFFIIIVNLIGLFAGAYVFSLIFPDWKGIPDSATRLAMFFPPLMIYYSALVFGKLFFKNK